VKIQRVEVFGVAVPLIGEYKNAYLAKTVQKSAIVRITASGGVVGLGNIDPGPGYSKEGIVDHLRVLDTQLKPLLLGMDPCNIHEVMARIEPAVAGYLDSKAAIEMACVDLAARAQGVAVHTYLGGAVTKRLSFNAWIGILPPEKAAAETLEWKKRGFRSAKIKVGGGVEADRERVKQASREMLNSIKARLAELDRFWEKEQTKGEVEAFNELFHRHKQSVYAFIRRFVTDTDAADGYPIAGFTWILVYREQAYAGRAADKAQALLARKKWAEAIWPRTWKTLSRFSDWRSAARRWQLSPSTSLNTSLIPA